MIGITNAGGGGNGLLRMISVYGAPSAPANPKEWDIFINTSTPLSQGEITTNVLTKPSWTAIEGTFYVGLKPGGFDTGSQYLAWNNKHHFSISGYPAQAFEMINGQWRPMNAYVWHNNKWVQFSWSYNGELFYQGNQYTDVTGGWVSTANCQNGWYVDGSEKWIWPHAPALEISTVMKVWQTSNPWVGTVFTGKAVDVTNYSKLYVDLQYNCIGAGVNNGFNICVTKSNGNNFTPLAEYNVDTGNGNKSYDGTIAIDLSSISGEVYVAIASHQHGGTDTGNNIVNIRKIWRA